MSYPAVFAYASASTAVKALLGTSPVRFWPFDKSPSPGQTGYAVPYATHQQVYGVPENTLSCPPVEDQYGIQIDSYGANATECRNVAKALRAAMESHGYIVSLGSEEVDEPTGLYRNTMTVEFIVDCN